jgi:glutamine synthetase
MQQKWQIESVYLSKMCFIFLPSVSNTNLCRLLTRSLGVDHNITPCFMAKPLQGLPGSSGHIHVSLVDSNGKNLFARDSPNPNPQWKDLEHFSDLGCHFLAGIIDALPDIMPLFAPTVISYKRYVENFWAPVFVTWGFEDRIASLRLIGPPSCKPSATRIEVRIPGADLHPHYALSVIFSAGLRGIHKKLDIKVPPQSARKKTDGKPLRLADTLQQALDRFSAPESIARELLGDEFVDFFTISRRHELKLWREAVTDWEFTRYIELV